MSRVRNTQSGAQDELTQQQGERGKQTPDVPDNSRTVHAVLSSINRTDHKTHTCGLSWEAGAQGLMAMRKVISRSNYVELPLEDPLSAAGRYVGMLERAMYGTRDAPTVPRDHLREIALGMKF